MTFAQHGGIVVHNGVLGNESATRLANALRVESIDANLFGGYASASIIAGSPAILYGVRNIDVALEDIRKNKCVNDNVACALTMDKFRALMTMKREGVSVPRFWSRIEMVVPWGSGRRYVFPIIARRREHSNGSGLWVCLTPLDVEIALRKGAHHFLEFVQIHKNYRVYVYKGKVVDVIEKCPSMDATLIDLVSRNDDEGWDWNVIPHAPQKVVQNAVLASRALGMDLCAVDVAMNRAGKVFVFEVNGASWMTDETAQKYARIINEDYAK